MTCGALTLWPSPLASASGTGLAARALPQAEHPGLQPPVRLAAGRGFAQATQLLSDSAGLPPSLSGSLSGVPSLSPHLLPSGYHLASQRFKTEGNREVRAAPLRKDTREPSLSAGAGASNSFCQGWRVREASPQESPPWFVGMAITALAHHKLRRAEFTEFTVHRNCESDVQVNKSLRQPQDPCPRDSKRGPSDGRRGALIGGRNRGGLIVFSQRKRERIWRKCLL